MKVILRADVKGVGRKGDLKIVADGFALNSLFPKQLAIAATKEAMADLEHAERKRIQNEKEEIAILKKLATEISGRTLSITRKAEKGKLFGAIHEGDIVESFAREGFTIGKKQILLEKNIKEVGTYSIGVSLGHGVRATCGVIVATG